MQAFSHLRTTREVKGHLMLCNRWKGSAGRQGPFCLSGNFEARCAISSIGSPDDIPPLAGEPSFQSEDRGYRLVEAAPRHGGITGIAVTCHTDILSRLGDMPLASWHRNNAGRRLFRDWTPPSRCSHSGVQPGALRDAQLRVGSCLEAPAPAETIIRNLQRSPMTRQPKAGKIGETPSEKRGKHAAAAKLRKEVGSGGTIATPLKTRRRTMSAHPIGSRVLRVPIALKARSRS